MSTLPLPNVSVEGTTVPPPPDRKTIPLRQFHADAELRAADVGQRTFVRTAMANYMGVREKTQALFADYQAARVQAAAVKWEALNHLESLLLEFEKNATARGTHVHWAADGASVCRHVVDILKAAGATKAIKSKSMATEEVHLNHALHEAGIEAVESDLGEFILQLRDEAPYHFVFPSMHLRRGEIKDVFSKHFEGLTADDPETLTLFARDILRSKYLEADVGISGGNFGVADSGAIAITENEGNARLTCAMPRIHIVVMGIEKIIPKLEDLAILQPMLGTAGAGQLLTGYNSVYFGPRAEGESDGPEQMHVILLDNGRTKLLGDAHLRDALRCIRCGACLNVCPIFQNVGGHTYGTTYQGPIGAVISPPMRGVGEFGHLAFASSLCGACTETCPVKIDLHHHLLRIRQQYTKVKHKVAESAAMRGFSLGMRHPALYRVGARLALTLDRWTKPLHGSAIDPLKAWRRRRTLPDKPPESFMHWWKRRQS
ncbi:MAG: lactate utilization protein B [Tepidisphaeraceae bacterium]